MACLRGEEGLTLYQGTGKVVNLAVCGMERKVHKFLRFARVFHVLSGSGAIFIWLECAAVVTMLVCYDLFDFRLIPNQ